jgi:DNA-binding IclR family transcriptional regulator
MKQIPYYSVRALDRALSILNALAEQDSEVGVTQLSEGLGMHKSTVHRLLAVLERNQYVEKNPADSKYHLGWKPFELGMRAVSRLDFCDLARPCLERLVKETGETAHLGILRQGDIISLVNAESQRTLSTPSTVGRRTPAHCTSLGKAILAFLPRPQITEFLRTHSLKPYTRHTITQASRLKVELGAIRKRGYALDNEEFEEGLLCIGAPVRNHAGKVMAAISIAGPAFRLGGEATAALARPVVEAAGRLSAALGYRKEDVRRRLVRERFPSGRNQKQ